MDEPSTERGDRVPPAHPAPVTPGERAPSGTPGAPVAPGAPDGPGSIGRRAWWAAALLSLLFLAGLAAVWYLAATDADGRNGAGTPLLGAADVEAYLADHPVPAVTGPGGSPPPSPPNGTAWRIPTGVFVQSLEFTGSNNVLVTGYVWQKYPVGVPDDLTRGFVLPEALEEAHEANEVDRYVEDGVEVVTWYLYATLRQRFDYGRYPFDRHTVWLRLWHPDRDQNVVLVPDFAAYPDITPEAMPGVDDQVVYVGWEPEYAGFSYATHTYTTTLGYAPGQSTLGGPELYFNVGLNRAFARPLVSDVIPVSVVFLLLFVCLSLTSTDGARLLRSGFDTSAALGLCAALLFVALLAHNLIRGVVPAGQLAYLEEVVIVGYLAIFLVAVNAAWLGRRDDGGQPRHPDNAVAKLCYWPLLTGVLFVVTVASLRPW